MKNLLITLLILISLKSYSQNNIVISSKIWTENNTCETEKNEKIILLEIKTGENYKTIKKIIINNCLNYYTFPKFVGEFRATINSENYETKRLDFEINATSKDTLMLNEIVLKKQIINSLNEVTIFGIKKQYIKIDSDKTTVLVKTNEMLAEGNAYDAATKLPGVLLDPNGNVILNGKTVSIWIDGQPSGLTGQDLINFLNNLPANVIEKVEIISNPGASYDANTSGGIINIITTTKTMKGLSGTVNLYYGRSNYDKFGSSLVLNGKIKKIGWQVSTGYSENKSSEDKTMKSKFLDYNPNVVLNQNYFTENSNKPYFLRTSFDYAISKNANIGFKYNLNKNKNKSNTDGTIFSENAIPNFTFNSISKPIETNSQNEILLYYKQKIDTLGKELNVSTNFSIFDKEKNNLVSQYSSNATNSYSLSNNTLKINNNFIKADLTIPYKKFDFTLNLGTKLSFSKVNSNGLYNFNNPSSQIFSNPIYLNELQFNYNQSNYAFYVETSKKIKKLSINTGLRYEYFKIKSNIENSNSNYNQNYSNFFPSASLLYNIAESVDFTCSYTRKIELPGYSELDPNISGNFDNYTQIQGNPNLQPNFYNNFEAKLSLLKYAYLGFNYSNSKTQNLLVIENSGNFKTSQTYKTFLGLKNYDFSIGLPIPYAIFTEGSKLFKKEINIDKLSFLYLIAGYNYYKINNADEYVSNFKPYYYINAYSQIVLPLSLKLGLNYSYVTKGTYQIYQINNPIHKLDLTLSRSFLNKSLKVTFSAKDIFKTFKTNALTQANNINIDYSMLNDTQSYRVGISYNFGKFSALHKQKGIEEEEELKRIEKKSEIGPKTQ